MSAETALVRTLKSVDPTTARAFGLLVLVVAGFVVISGSVSMTSLANVARQASALGVATLAQALVLSLGRIDLANGAIISLSNVLLSAMMAGNAVNLDRALAVTFVAAALTGLLSGVMCTRLRIPSFLATLAVSLALQGGLLVYTGGSPKGGIPDEFRVVAEGWIGPVPISVIIWAVLAIFVGVGVFRSVAGRKMLLVGGNIRMAHFSGINTTGTTIAVFILGGLLSAVAGCLLTAYIGTSSLGVGADYTMNSIAAAVVGGATFTGGIFRPWGSIAGTLILVFVQSIMFIISASEGGKFIAQGLIILVVLAFASFRRSGR